jgi:hypothetical protein
MRRYPGMKHGNRQLVSLLLIRQRFRCVLCEHLLIVGDERLEYRATLEHLTPLVFGGEPYGDNAVAACAKCNCLKGPLTAAEYAAVRNDHPERRRLLREAQERVARITPEEKAANFARIRRTIDESWVRLWDELQSHLVRYRRERDAAQRKT